MKIIFLYCIDLNFKHALYLILISQLIILLMIVDD